MAVNKKRKAALRWFGYIGGSSGGGSTPPPDYTTLTNLIVLLKSSGLVVGESNDYGTVDGSGNVLEMKSVLTPSAHLFEDNGTAPTLTADGVLFGASGRLRAADSLTWANPLHYNANINNLSWTIHRVGRIGANENPGATIGLLGNNATSALSKGISIYYSDASTNSNKLFINISKGTTSVFIAEIACGDCIIPGHDFLLSVRYIHSNSQNSRFEIYVNGRLMLNQTVRNDNNTPVTAPTHQFEIGGCGNATVSGVQTIKELSIQTGIDSDVVFQEHMRRLIAYPSHGIATTQDSVPVDYVFNVLNILSEGRYPFSSKILQSKSNPDVLVNPFGDWVIGHQWNDGNCISAQKSLDRGPTWGSKGVIYNPTPNGVLDMGAGIDASGRMYFYTDEHNSAQTVHKLILGHTDNDGGTWEIEDLSSLIPVGRSLRCIGTLSEANGVIMFPWYSFDPSDVNPNTRHVARKVGDGAWTRVDVEETTTTYRNESDLIHLGGDTWLMVTRNETTFEFTAYITTNNGATWINTGDLPFGESWTGAAPPCLDKYKMNGIDVAVCRITDRPNRKMLEIHGLASDLMADGISGWNLDTKILLRIPNGTNLYHYGGTVHPYDDFRAIGSYAFDAAGWGASSTTQMHRFTLPTWHYNTVKTALGL